MVFRVATRNRVKMRAVRKALLKFFRNPVVVCVNPCPTPVQPKTLSQTIMCAKKRAREAFVNPYLSIGVEAGLWHIESLGYLNICVCCIYDGRNYYLGFGPAFVLPGKMAKLMVSKGLSLEEAVRRVLKANPRKYGAIGAISKNRVKREEIIFYATLMALSHMKMQKLK
jgi:inosine/xanthosine triphosphatase